MSYAPDYTPGTSFADDETNNVAGRSLVKTDRLDSELADISASINALNDNQKAFQRDDGKLADSLVEPYALAEQTKALIAVAGCNPRGVWAPNTDYFYKDVIQRNNIAQICLQAHNSGSTFTQSFWLPISGDGTSAANAAAAAASASSAATSASSATASASSATASASAAYTSATNAETAATNAVNSAISASTNATNAANSADEAIAAAESITTPLNATSDPTFASIVNDQAVSPEWVIGLFGTKLNMQVFNSSGTFTVPARVTKCNVLVVAAGGNGGSAQGGGRGGTGGFGGAASKLVTGLTPLSTISVTVGASNSQSSSFGVHVSATGGGTGGASTGGTDGGNGGNGVGAGGDLNYYNNINLGVAAGQVGPNSNGANGIGLGSGGSGGNSNAAGGATRGGGAGAPGIVIVEW